MTKKNSNAKFSVLCLVLVFRFTVQLALQYVMGQLEIFTQIVSAIFRLQENLAARVTCFTSNSNDLIFAMTNVRRSISP